jgi:hypothetical protein
LLKGGEDVFPLKMFFREIGGKSIKQEMDGNEKNCFGW